MSEVVHHNGKIYTCSGNEVMSLVKSTNFSPLPFYVQASIIASNSLDSIAYLAHLGSNKN